MKSKFNHIRALLQRMGIIFLFYSILRIAFYFFNKDLYQNSDFSELMASFVYGWRYDLSAIVYSNILIILLTLSLKQI